MYNGIKDSLSNYLESFINSLPDVILALIILIMFILAGSLWNRIFRRRIQHRWKDNLVSLFVAKVVKWAFYLIGIILALDIMGFGRIAASMVAGVGISAIIFGFAFKDIAENFLAGFLLAFNRPFKVGDIIEIGGYKGPIKKIDLRNTHIRTVDGRDIYIPNSILIKDILTNYTRDGLIRLEFLVGLDQNDDLDKAREVILEHLLQQKDVLKKPEPNVHVELLGVSSIDLKVLFWINILKSTSDEKNLIGEPVRSRLMREVKDLLLEKGFNLPSSIVEHKMYDKDDALSIEMKK